MNTRAFADNVRRKLADTRRDEEWLSKAVGINPDLLQKIMAYKRQPTIYILYRTAHSLGCPIESLLEGIEEG